MKVPVVYLKAGEIHVSDKPTLVKTVLGSCVAVTMFYPGSGIGAMCHGLLPECEERNTCRDICNKAFKYVECSIKSMVREFDRYEIKRGDIRVKLFGGADMLSYKKINLKAIGVGRENIKTALRTIKTADLKIVTTDLGGLHGRKVFFNTSSGEVFMKRL